MACPSAVCSHKCRVFGAVSYANPINTDPDQNGAPRVDCTAPFNNRVDGGAVAEPGKAKVASAKPAYNYAGYSVAPTQAWQGDAVVYR
jgi:hypothetical protein